MTGRERVRRCLDRTGSDWPPRDGWFSPGTQLRHGPDALRARRARWPLDFVPASGAIAQFEFSAGVPLANADAVFEAWYRAAGTPPPEVA